ncbi:alginate export family protein [Caminibacter sp.]
MKKIILISLLIIGLFAKEYSIIAFSTKKLNCTAALKFKKRFPKGIIKQYSRFVEYKIEPFKSYIEAKEFVKKVKKYYRYPLIIPYRPHLGKVINLNICLKNKNFIQNNKKFLKLLSKKIYIAKCKTKCGCPKKQYIWELNNSKILKEINISVKKYVNFEEKNISNSKYSETNITEINITETNKTALPPASLIYYIDLFGNIYDGQNDGNYHIKGDSENIKLGLIYEKYFGNLWKFYTDDRVILSRKHTNKTSTSLYFDINELYIRSFYLTNFADLLIGRKKTKDIKSWWFNNNLDQIRVFNENNLLTYKILFATRFDNKKYSSENNINANVKNSKYFIANINDIYYYQKSIGAYFIYENVKPQTFYIKQKNRYFGIYNYDNNFLKGMAYWINFGFAKGKRYYFSSTQTINGLGFDVGLKKIFNSFLLAGSYVYGSKNFTQPYIATNYSDFLQKNLNVKYYGYILNPKAENINIINLYAIKNFDENKSIYGSIHFYRQTKARKVTYDNYFYSTDGKNKNLGSEIDLVYQYLLQKNKKLKIGAAYFIGSKAYDYLKKKNVFRIFINYRKYFR